MQGYPRIAARACFATDNCGPSVLSPRLDGPRAAFVEK